MGPMNLQRAVWTLERLRLRHGALAWGVAVAALALLVAGLGAASASWRLARADADLAQRIAAYREHATAARAPVAEAQASLPLAADRFEINRRVLATLADGGFAPEHIRFKFEPVPDTGLTRQVAVFTVTAPWRQVARLLDRLQHTDRALYLAKLRIAREDADDATVAAEIQLAAALPDATVEDASAGGEAP